MGQQVGRRARCEAGPQTEKNPKGSARSRASKKTEKHRRARREAGPPKNRKTRSLQGLGGAELCTFGLPRYDLLKTHEEGAQFCFCPLRDWGSCTLAEFT